MTKDDREHATWERYGVEITQISAGLPKEGGQQEESVLTTWPEAESHAAVLPDHKNAYTTGNEEMFE
jgi:hypothetical protein